MTSKIKYPTIGWPLLYSELPPPYHNCVHFAIYDWNSSCIIPLASYSITTEKEPRRKSSIPLFYAHWFIRNSHPNSTTVQILIYTIEVGSAAHQLRAMPSQQRWNYIENQVSHYFMPTDLLGTPTPIAQLCKFWYIRLKWCLQHTTCELWHHNRDGITSKIKYPTILCPLIHSELPPQ